MPYVAVLLLILGLLAGCAPKITPDEFAAARAALEAAERAGAQKRATEEYEAARLTLDYGKRQAEKGRDEKARKILGAAIDLAHEAEMTACQRSVNLAQKRVAQLEAQQAMILKAWRETSPEGAVPLDLTGEIEPPTATPLTSYTISEGENLFSIAAKRKVYGDALLWPLIYKANRDQIKNPKQVYPGQVLSIPRNASEEEKEQARTTARESTIFSQPATAPKAP